jgi:hypothetical protein
VSIPTWIIFLFLFSWGFFATEYLIMAMNKGKLRVRVKMKDGSEITRYVSAQWLADNRRPYICPTCAEGEG